MEANDKNPNKIRTKQGLYLMPIWNLQSCLYWECCPEETREARVKTLIKKFKKCMYNPSVFKCPEFIKRNRGEEYDLDWL